MSYTLPKDIPLFLGAQVLQLQRQKNQKIADEAFLHMKEKSH